MNSLIRYLVRLTLPANLSAEEITQLSVDANLATATNVTDAVDAINLSLSNLGFATPDNVERVSYLTTP